MTATGSARPNNEPGVDDDALVRGNGRFVHDPRLPNQAYAALAISAWFSDGQNRPPEKCGSRRRYVQTSNNSADVGGRIRNNNGNSL